MEVLFMKAKNKDKLFILTCLALLTAMQIILARYLVIPVSESLRFSMSFIPVVIAARRFGIVGGMTVYGIGDFLGAIIFPSGGAFFPGFTVTAVVSGLIYGLFLAKKGGILRIVLSVVVSQVVCTLLMNSYWLSVLMGSAFSAIFLSRIPQALIMSVLQIVFMALFLEKICKAVKFRH
jgi:ECF transporter S component (folate family)